MIALFYASALLLKVYTSIYCYKHILKLCVSVKFNLSGSYFPIADQFIIKHITRSRHKQQSQCKCLTPVKRAVYVVSIHLFRYDYFFVFFLRQSVATQSIHEIETIQSIHLVSIVYISFFLLWYRLFRLLCLALSIDDLNQPIGKMYYTLFGIVD